MSELMTSQGTIEMLRYTLEDKIERYDINGGTLINGDGVWCYQIPMNLDYVITDERGNLVPATEPGKGIPTRTKTRFRVTLNDNGDEFTQDKTGVYLIPNNPTSQIDEDYQFNNNCKPNSFTDLMWNKVYSVKNYIPRIQKGFIAIDRHFNGIKSVNYHEGNNPVPYNNIWININLRFMLICLLTKLLIDIVGMVNDVIDAIEEATRGVVRDRLSNEFRFIHLSSQIGGNECSILSNKDYFVPFKKRYAGKDSIIAANDGEYPNTLWCSSGQHIDEIKSCIETQLSNEEQVVNFDFTNDWLNGSLYAPRYLTKTKRNGKTGEKKVKYCGSYGINKYPNMYLLQTCSPSINRDGDNDGVNEACTTRTSEDNKSIVKQKCYIQFAPKKISDGIIKREELDDIYYYRGVEFPNSSINSSLIKYLNATNIILLGSLIDCDQDGIPQLHRSLPSTTFKLPPDSFEPEEILDNVGVPIPVLETDLASKKEMSGVDWGNSYANQENGLFVGVDCMSSTTTMKTCINATRLCELGVDFDEKTVIEYGTVTGVTNIDGFISLDEISDGDARGMFSTLNGNGLKTKPDKYKQLKYDFTYNFPDGFDGKLRATDVSKQGGNLPSDLPSNDYYKFRFGDYWANINESYYTTADLNGSIKYSFPKYSNSFYFYFGLKPGLTAIDVFNNQYFVPCSEPVKDKFELTLEVLNNEGLCQGPPTLTMGIITDASADTISISNNKIQANGNTIVEKGVCYAPNPNATPLPDYNMDKVNSGIGNTDYTTIIPGLSGVTYYIRAYVKTSDDIYYSSASHFRKYAPSLTHTGMFVNGVLEEQYDPLFTYTGNFMGYVEEEVES